MKHCSFDSSLLKYDCTFKQIYFELTNQCNLRCSYCFNKSNCSKKIELSKDYIMNIINNFSNKCNIFLSGGEPLLHLDFEDILSSIVKRGHQVTVLTNGTLINEFNLKDNSLDFRWQIGNGLLDNTDNDAERLKNNVSRFIKSHPNTEIVLAYTITKKNYKYMYEYIQEFIKYKNINFLLSFVQKRGRAMNGWGDIALTRHQKIKIIGCVKALYRPPKVSFCGLELDSDYKEIFGQMRNCQVKEKQCITPKELYVTYEGKIHFCRQFDDIKNSLNICTDNIDKYDFTSQLEIRIPSKKVKYVSCICDVFNDK